VTREILFYSDLPYGHHNPEAEERMRRFARRGYRVIYVPKLGIRNPRPAHLAGAIGRLAGNARRVMKAPEHGQTGRGAFDVVDARLLPPRHREPLDRLNRAWLTSQLGSRLTDASQAIAWIRFPTPELVPMVESLPFRAVVYELVDSHEAAGGFNERHRRLFLAAERRILGRADVVFASSEPIRARLAKMRPDVIRLPAAAVDFAALAAAGSTRAPTPRLAVHVGGLNERMDADLLADVAGGLGGWRFLLAGPAAAALRNRLAGLENVEMPGRVEASRVPELIAAGAVGLMPYRVNAFNRTLFPVKMIECLAVGRPLVSTPIDAATEFEDVVAVADDADAFSEAIVREAAADSQVARERRLARAAPFDWDHRLDEMEAAIEEAIAGRR
jgi:glycosyltransferase involved in cell wall biosynthesis